MAEKAERDQDKGRKDRRNENIELYCQSFKRCFEFKGKNIATISLCLIPLSSIFKDMRHIEEQFLNSNFLYLLVLSCKCNIYYLNLRNLFRKVYPRTCHL